MYRPIRQQDTVFKGIKFTGFFGDPDCIYNDVVVIGMDLRKKLIERD